MRTSNLSIAVGAYSDGSWHVTLLQSEYKDGVLVDHVATANRWLTEREVLASVRKATQRIIDIERRRVELGTRRAAPTPASPPRP